MEPTVRILKNWIKSEKDPEHKTDYQARYTMLLDQLKKTHEQTKVSFLQRTMKLFSANTDTQTDQNKALSVTQTKSSPKSK